MSNPENNSVEPVEIDLDDFSKEFFGDDQEPNASKEKPVKEDEQEESDAPTELEDTLDRDWDYS